MFGAIKGLHWFRRAMAKSLVQLLQERDKKPAATAKAKAKSKPASGSSGSAGAGSGKGSSGDAKLQGIYGKPKAKPKSKNPKSVMKNLKPMKKGSGSKGVATESKKQDSTAASPAANNDGGDDSGGDDDAQDPASKKSL